MIALLAVELLLVAAYATRVGIGKLITRVNGERNSAS